MNNLHSIIKTDKKTYQICENSLAGTTPFMEPLQKKFSVYEIKPRVIGSNIKRLLNRKNGGFDTIEQCEKAIEISCKISFFEIGWYKCIEKEIDKNENLIVRWVKRIETTWDENKQIINGVKQSFYGNGILSNLETYQDRQLLEEKHWNENGFLSYVGKYENGKKEGKHISYGENGRIETNVSYQNGMLHGVHEKWGYTIESGKFIQQSLTTFHKNKRHGPYKVWHRNGFLWEESNYHAGKLDGQYKEYDREGNIFKNECYNMGVKKEP
mgnify:FL=1|tara:strand:+ start:819 stop:1625 length:807 start_codon:yes stop_codon:yes gene_type:complete